jgi:hypothetical protein
VADPDWIVVVWWLPSAIVGFQFVLAAGFKNQKEHGSPDQKLYFSLISGLIVSEIDRTNSNQQ